MKVLGLDTSHYANSVGIVGDGRVLADLTWQAWADSLVKITSNLDEALQNAGIKLADLEGFGVGLGPGSWTGIRVGVTVGKMLAYATGKPVCGVSTLEALAREAGQTDRLICPVVGAGRGDAVYAALYRAADGAVQRVGDYYVGDITGLAELITQPAVIVGGEAWSYRERIAGLVKVGITAKKTLPRGSAVARIAAARLERGEKDDTLALTPLYLKESTFKVFQGITRDARTGN